MTMAASWHGHDTIAWRLSNLLDEAGRSSFLEQVRDLLPESDAVGAGSEPDRQKPENRESPNPPGRRFGDEATRFILRNRPTDLPKQYRRLLQAFRLAGEHVDPDILATSLLIAFPWIASTVAAILSGTSLSRPVGSPW